MTRTEWAPGVAQFRGYKRAWLRGDLLAGLTVAAYLIPQVMAYATLAGLSPIVGLWAALAPLLIYALLGSSRHVSVGPAAGLGCGPRPPRRSARFLGLTSGDADAGDAVLAGFKQEQIAAGASTLGTLLGNVT